MDIIDRHFAAENAHDVQATLDTYTDDIVWDDVTHPDAPFHGNEEVAKVYSSIIDAIPDVELVSVKRFTGEAGRYIVDTVLIAGRVMKRSGELLHVDWGAVRRTAEDARDHVIRKSGFKLPKI